MTDPSPVGGSSIGGASEQPWVSLTDHALGLSLEAPAGWSRSTSATFPLQLRAPSTSDGHRATCMFSHERFDPPTPEGLAAFVVRTAEAQERDYEGFERLDHDEVIVDGRPGSVIEYRWDAPDLGPMRQLLGLLVIEPGLLLEVDAASRAEVADERLAECRRIIASVRFLTPP